LGVGPGPGPRRCRPPRGCPLRPRSPSPRSQEDRLCSVRGRAVRLEDPWRQFATL
jgi:hypothetical protein